MNYWALECFPAGSALLLPWAALGEAAFALRAQFAPSFSGAVGQQADQPGEDLAGSYLCVAGMTPGLMGCPPRPPEPAAVRAALFQQRGTRAQLRRLVRPAGQPAAVRDE